LGRDPARQRQPQRGDERGQKNFIVDEGFHEKIWIPICIFQAQQLRRSPLIFLKRGANST
jgi:hypothetical protein